MVSANMNASKNQVPTKENSLKGMNRQKSAIRVNSRKEQDLRSTGFLVQILHAELGTTQYVPT